MVRMWIWCLEGKALGFKTLVEGQALSAAPSQAVVSVGGTERAPFLLPSSSWSGVGGLSAAGEGARAGEDAGLILWGQAVNPSPRTLWFGGPWGVCHVDERTDQQDRGRTGSWECNSEVGVLASGPPHTRLPWDLTVGWERSEMGSSYLPPFCLAQEAGLHPEL